MKHFILKFLSVALLSTTFGAQGAAANELGGVSFTWTLINPNGPFKGRFTNNNSSCKVVIWQVFSNTGTPLDLGHNNRIDATSAVDVDVSASSGSADVRIQQVRDC